MSAESAMTIAEQEGRVCALDGCDLPVRSNAPHARFCSDSHRTAAWKAEQDYVDPRASRASRNARRGPRRPTAPRISYAKALDALADAFADVQVVGAGYSSSLEDARERAAGILDPLLTPAGRKALGR